jgi:hypothetical protein
MDSLPTGATQSLFLVLAAAFSPVILLFFVDVIGRARRRRVRPANGPPADTGDRERGHRRDQVRFR